MRVRIRVRLSAARWALNSDLVTGSAARLAELRAGGSAACVADGSSGLWIEVGAGATMRGKAVHARWTLEVKEHSDVQRRTGTDR
jgi:hypothetical protein